MARAAERQQRNRTITKWTAIVVVILVIGGAVAFTIAKLTSGTPAAASSPTASATSASASPSTSPTASPTVSPTPTVPAGDCAYARTATAARKVGLPPVKPDPTAHYTATIKTNRGDIVISLLSSKAPCTVNSFVYLAGKNYFSSTSCHRLTTSGIYVLQCGDPTGTGTGGPGYQFGDENLTGATYKAGTVAMANSGPNTNGSQFFLVYKDSTLAPSYTPFGTIVSGVNIIQNVAKAGTDNSNGTGDGHPKESVVIESVTISKT
jgi:peptidyl-prolyl cis-trans isomerase B (cyclophilin B)